MMNRQTQAPVDQTLIAGELSLDFANTADWHATNRPEERLRDYGDLVHWSKRAGLLDETGAERLLDQAGRRPEAAKAVLRRAIRLREIIYRIAVASVQKRAPTKSDVDALNRALASALKHLRLVPRGEKLVWNWQGVDRALDGVLWPILYSAADLLTSDRQTRIGQCADDRGCGWLFLDSSKNRSRRWCEMKDCGNRAKAQRHYRRTRGTDTRRVDRSRSGRTIRERDRT